MASTNKTDFASDPRMTLNEQTGKWSYVGEEGVSYEYDENVGAWFPMVSLYLYLFEHDVDVFDSTTKNSCKHKHLCMQLKAWKRPSR